MADMFRDQMPDLAPKRTLVDLKADEQKRRDKRKLAKKARKRNR
jgi:hypothetical protein